MGVFDFLKSKEKARGLEIPPAPPMEKGELPEFPEIPEEVAVKRAVEKPNISSVEDMEKTAVRIQKSELKQMEHMRLTKPIFINVKNYRDVLGEIGLIKNLMKEENDVVSRISEFKEDENKEFTRWQKAVADVQKKLIYVDKTLFG